MSRDLTARRIVRNSESRQVRQGRKVGVLYCRHVTVEWTNGVQCSLIGENDHIRAWRKRGQCVLLKGTER